MSKSYAYQIGIWHDFNGEIDRVSFKNEVKETFSGIINYSFIEFDGIGMFVYCDGPGFDLEATLQEFDKIAEKYTTEVSCE